jgi:glycosyltransferase involved in cell wall biosynthesis
MRIAVLTSLFPSLVKPHEGIFAQRRWSRMRRRGHEVRVVHPLPWAPVSLGRREWAQLRAMAPREERDGLEIRRPRYLHVPRRALGNARAFARRGVEGIERGGAVDCVVADYAWPAAAAAELCAQRGWPLVISGRGSDVLQVAALPALREQLARGLRSAGQWCAVSEHLVRAMDDLAGQPGRGVLVANGVDTEFFGPRERAACRAKLRLDREALVVLVVGHLIERKDPLLALDCFARLQRQRAPRPARLEFIGAGPLDSALRDAIGARGLESSVRLHGEQSPEQLADWYGAADALLLTSTREGRPNVVLEALACGLPVLATDAGGTSELLGADSPMLARTRDPEALAQQLDQLVEAPRDESALRALAERWSWDAGLDALEALLERAVAARRGGAA